MLRGKRGNIYKISRSFNTNLSFLNFDYKFRWSLSKTQRKKLDSFGIILYEKRDPSVFKSRQICQDSVSQSKCSEVENKEIYLSRSEFAERTSEIMTVYSPFRRGVTRSSVLDPIDQAADSLPVITRGRRLIARINHLALITYRYRYFPEVSAIFPLDLRPTRLLSPCLDEPYSLRTRLNIEVWSPFSLSLSLSSLSSTNSSLVFFPTCLRIRAFLSFTISGLDNFL